MLQGMEDGVGWGEAILDSPFGMMDDANFDISFALKGDWGIASPYGASGCRRSSSQRAGLLWI